MLEAVVALIGAVGIALGAVVYAFFVAGDVDDHDDHDDWRHA